MYEYDDPDLPLRDLFDFSSHPLDPEKIKKSFVAHPSLLKGDPSYAAAYGPEIIRQEVLYQFTGALYHILPEYGIDTKSKNPRVGVSPENILNPSYLSISVFLMRNNTGKNKKALAEKCRQFMCDLMHANGEPYEEIPGNDGTAEYLIIFPPWDMLERLNTFLSRPAHHNEEAEKCLRTVRHLFDRFKDGEYKPANQLS